MLEQADDASQRCHWWVNAISAPDHWPGEDDSVAPISAAPLTTGGSRRLPWGPRRRRWVRATSAPRRRRLPPPQCVVRKLSRRPSARGALRTPSLGDGRISVVDYVPGG